jgi:hypothetical protein
VTIARKLKVYPLNSAVSYIAGVNESANYINARCNLISNNFPGSKLILVKSSSTFVDMRGLNLFFGTGPKRQRIVAVTNNINGCERMFFICVSLIPKIYLIRKPTQRKLPSEKNSRLNEN